MRRRIGQRAMGEGKEENGWRKEEEVEEWEEERLPNAWTLDILKLCR